MNDNNLNKCTESRLDSRVFDYVAGNISGFEKCIFELELRYNKSLQQKVDAERLLRSALTSYEYHNSSNYLHRVSSRGFRRLLSKLEITVQNSKATNMKKKYREE